MRHGSLRRTWIAAACCCAGLSWATLALANDTTPADPSNTDNQMITDCLASQDPAMKKDDAVELCKKKLGRGIDLDRKAKRKPPADSAPPAGPPPK